MKSQLNATGSPSLALAVTSVAQHSESHRWSIKPARTNNQNHMIKKENCEVQATLLQFTGNVKKFHAWSLPCPMQTWLPEPSRFSSSGVASLLQGQCRAMTFQQSFQTNHMAPLHWLLVRASLLNSFVQAFHCNVIFCSPISTH